MEEFTIQISMQFRTVNVRNNGHDGRYYTVKYFLKDYDGKTTTESLTYYVNAHQSREFTYKNVFNAGKEYLSWSYQIIPSDY